MDEDGLRYYRWIDANSRAFAAWLILVVAFSILGAIVSPWFWIGVVAYVGVAVWWIIRYLRRLNPGARSTQTPQGPSVGGST